VRGRETAIVFNAVFVAEYAQIYTAAAQFSQVCAVSALIGRRKIFKKKCVKKTTEQWITLHKITNSLPLAGQLFLDTAYENTFFHTVPSGIISLDELGQFSFGTGYFLFGTLPLNGFLGADIGGVRFPQAGWHCEK
jgi:hypothetical protein